MPQSQKNNAPQMSESLQKKLMITGLVLGIVGDGLATPTIYNAIYDLVTEQIPAEEWSIQVLAAVSNVFVDLMLPVAGFYAGKYIPSTIYSFFNRNKNGNAYNEVADKVDAEPPRSNIASPV